MRQVLPILLKNTWSGVSKQCLMPFHTSSYDTYATVSMIEIYSTTNFKSSSYSTNPGGQVSMPNLQEVHTKLLQQLARPPQVSNIQMSLPGG